MYTPLHLLPDAASPDSVKFKNRWETPEGRELHERIMQMIRKGAGEDFLQWDFEQHRLGFIEHMHDLRGFSFFNEEIVFPRDETFEHIDFSYGKFYHSKMTNALFECTMDFTKFYNCTFTKCMFWFNNCYACHFERVRFVDCDFIEHNSFTNCSFVSTTFENTFFHRNVFRDCKFDTKTSIPQLLRKPASEKKDVELEDAALADLYQGVSEAYVCGGATRKARRYLFLRHQAATRYNNESCGQKLQGLMVEYLMGYGLKPVRVLSWMFLLYLASLGAFCTTLGFRDALLLSCGALFTFGAKADLLNALSFGYQLLYILTSFVGVVFVALFVTVLANVLLRDK